jgi:hypothetical protein
MIRDRIENGNPALRKGYVGLFVSDVTVANQEITITGTRAALEAAITHGNSAGMPAVPSFDRGWCQKSFLRGILSD